jgi:bifunctional non-homologous end joining protein LigD
MPPRNDYVPQLATLVDTPPSGDEWLHEIKYDGYRIGARVRHGRVSLYTRNDNDWTTAFPDVADAVGHLRLDDALIDGEVAVVLPDGRTSFQALQNTAGGGNRRTLVYFVFDLLRINGETLERRPLEERKAVLKKLVGSRSTVAFASPSTSRATVRRSSQRRAARDLKGLYRSGAISHTALDDMAAG